jgi:hypothetical protein
MNGDQPGKAPDHPPESEPRLALFGSRLMREFPLILGPLIGAAAGLLAGHALGEDLWVVAGLIFGSVAGLILGAFVGRLSRK